MNFTTFYGVNSAVFGKLINKMIIVTQEQFALDVGFAETFKNIISTAVFSARERYKMV